MKAIIFDCDGVLVDSEAIYQGAEHKFLSELGVDYDSNAYAEKFMGMPTQVYFKTLAEHYKEQLPNGLPDDFEMKFKAHCHDQIISTLTIIPEADDFVSTLSLPYAVASSTRLEFLHQKLQITGLHAAFDPHIYSGDMVPRGKPFPDLFLHAAKQLEQDPEDCIVIEDSANGVKAGVAAGMRVIGFCAGGHCSDNHAKILRDAGAHDAVASYKELSTLLKL